jgi:hypothetical protein
MVRAVRQHDLRRKRTHDGEGRDQTCIPTVPRWEQDYHDVPLSISDDDKDDLEDYHHLTARHNRCDPIWNFGDI